MNRCPSCHYLVPAGWIWCRGCGGALPIARHSPAPIAEDAKRAWSRVAVSDTMLPLTPPSPPRPHSRRAVVFVAAELAVMLVATMVLALSDTQDFRQAEAVARLRSTARDARVFYAHRGTFDELHHAHAVSIVSASKVAKVAEVSFRSMTPTTLVLATPISRGTCVFARTSKHAPMNFAVTHGRACRASAAPRNGWTT